MPKGGNLGLERIMGRAVIPWLVIHTRDLTAEDIHIANTVEKGVEAAPLVRLSGRHHAMARKFASGMTLRQVSESSGLSYNRVSILRGDPSFAELVTHYQTQFRDAYMDVHEELAGLGMDAISEMRKRLEEEPEKLTFGQLLETTKVTADRTGFGPSSSSEVNVKIGIADKLEAARKRINEFRARDTIDITPECEAAE